MGLSVVGVLFMVTSSFPRFRQTGRYDPKAFPARGIDNGEQTVPGHAQQEVAGLGIGFPPILSDKRERIAARQPSGVETDAVAGELMAAFASSHSQSSCSTIYGLAVFLQGHYTFTSTPTSFS